MKIIKETIQFCVNDKIRMYKRLKIKMHKIEVNPNY